MRFLDQESEFWTGKKNQKTQMRLRSSRPVENSPTQPDSSVCSIPQSSENMTKAEHEGGLDSKGSWGDFGPIFLL